MKVTIKSIAEKAGVSRGTVDKVLNNRKGVSDQVRKEVQNIADEMGYRPNLAGKALAYQKNPLKIGIITLSKEDPLFQKVHHGINAAYQEFRDFGLAIEIRCLKNLDEQEQLNYIEELEKMDIKALIISPIDEEIIRKKLLKLKKQNIKIITFNTDISNDGEFIFVGQNLYKAGRVAGELMTKILPNGGELVIFSGDKKIRALKERAEGFKAIISEEHPDFKIIEELEDSNNDQEAYHHTIRLIEQYKNLKGIFLTGRGICGVCKALEENNKKNIKLVVYDLMDETKEYLKKNIIDFTITQEPYQQGYLPIKIVFDLFFKDIEVDANKIYTKLEIKTKENIDI